MDTIYGLTVNAIRQDDEDVALQAIEFWSTIAEAELGIQDEVSFFRQSDHRLAILVEKGSKVDGINCE